MHTRNGIFLNISYSIITIIISDDGLLSDSRSIDRRVCRLVVRSKDRIEWNNNIDIDDCIDVSSGESTDIEVKISKTKYPVHEVRTENVVKPEWYSNIQNDKFVRPRKRRPLPREIGTESVLSDTSGISRMSIISTRRERVRWTHAEEQMLLEGVRSYGREWAVMIEHYDFHSRRIPADLKDKYRNIQKNQLQHIGL